MIHTPTQRVEAGAKFLDGFYPEWRRHINRDVLDIASDCNCIVGQMFGSYNDGVAGLGISHREAISTGMFVPGSQTSKGVVREYELLTTAWVDHINLHRQPVAA